jgi:hypothetical protein
VTILTLILGAVVGSCVTALWCSRARIVTPQEYVVVRLTTKAAIALSFGDGRVYCFTQEAAERVCTAFREAVEGKPVDTAD